MRIVILIFETSTNNTIISFSLVELRMRWKQNKNEEKKHKKEYSDNTKMNWVAELRVFFYDSRIKSVRRGARCCAVSANLANIRTLTKTAYDSSFQSILTPFSLPLLTSIAYDIARFMSAHASAFKCDYKVLHVIA